MRAFLLLLGMLVLAVASGQDYSNSKLRSPHTVAEFRKTHACPATQKLSGACPGWVVDHKWPLCAGGKDEVVNMRWEAYAESKQKDKQEVAICNQLKAWSKLP